MRCHLRRFSFAAAFSTAIQTLSAFDPNTTSISKIGTWTLDPSWPLDKPKEADYYSAVAIDNTGAVHVSVRKGVTSPILVFDNDKGALLSSWGENDIYFDNCTASWGGHGLAHQVTANNPSRIWVADILNHTVKVFANDISSSDHHLIASAGTPGDAGSAVDPELQFGSVADVATGVAGGKFDGSVWVSDGDGGVNNRVLRLNTSDSSSDENDLWIGVHPEWVTGGAAADDMETFNSPHSIAYHEPSGTLIVADRDNFRLDILNAATGVKIAEWSDCLGGNGDGNGTAAPWGVRVWHGALSAIRILHDTVFAVVAVCDSPQDGGNQRLVVLNVSRPDSILHKGKRGRLVEKKGADNAVVLEHGRYTKSNKPLQDKDGDSAVLQCGVVAEISVDPSVCLTPHEIDVDESSGDIYLACVTTDPGPSNLVRYRYTG